MAVQIIEFHGDEKRYVDALLKAQERTRQLEEALKNAGKTSKQTAEDVADSFKQSEQEQAKMMNAMRAQLRALGPEGAAAAKAMADQMATQGKSSEIAVGELLDKIKLIDPAAAEAARAGFDAAKASIAEAAKFGEGAFQKPLDKLRSMGAEGKKAADAIRQRLVEAGQISEESFVDVVEQLRQLDPEAAKVAEEVKASLSQAAEESTQSWEFFGDNSLKAVTGVIGGYMSFSSLIQTVNQYLQEQVRLINKTKDVQITVGAAQQATLMNLAGFSEEDRTFLVGEAVDEISKEAAFADRAQILQAIGAIASVGITDRKQIVDIAKQSAKLTNLTPDQLPGLATATAATMMQGQFENANQALALVTTTTPLARMTKLTQLATVLPQVLASGLATSEGQTVEESAKQSVATFASLSQASQDQTGDITRTFMISFSTRLDEFFDNAEQTRAKAIDELAAIEKRKAEGKETESDKLRIPQLQEFISQSTNLQDTGDLIGRIETLQSLPAVAKLFQQTTPVENQFINARARLLNKDDPLLAEIKTSMEALSTDEVDAVRFQQFMKSATPQIQLAGTMNLSKAAVEQFDLQQGEAGRLAAVREIFNTTEESLRTNQGFMSTLGDWARDWTGGLQGTTPEEEAASAIKIWAQENFLDAQDGITPQERARMDFRRAQMETMSSLIRDPQAAANALRMLRTPSAAEERTGVIPLDVRSTANNPESDFGKLIALLERVAANTENTANNTTPPPPPEPQAVAPALSAPP